LSERLGAGHEVVAEVSAFNGLEIGRESFPGFDIKRRKALTIYKRK
jgi:hypothetical protein